MSCFTVLVKWSFFALVQDPEKTVYERSTTHTIVHQDHAVKPFTRPSGTFILKVLGLKE